MLFRSLTETTAWAEEGDPAAPEGEPSVTGFTAELARALGDGVAEVLNEASASCAGFVSLPMVPLSVKAAPELFDVTEGAAVQPAAAGAAPLTADLAGAGAGVAPNATDEAVPTVSERPEPVNGEFFDDATQAEINAAVNAANDEALPAGTGAADEATGADEGAAAEAEPYRADDMVLYADTADEGTAPSEGGVDISAANLDVLAAQIKAGARAYLLKKTTTVGGNYSQDPQLNTEWIDIKIGRAHV